jgi:hypothetical protein
MKNYDLDDFGNKLKNNLLELGKKEDMKMRGRARVMMFFINDRKLWIFFVRRKGLERILHRGRNYVLVRDDNGDVIYKRDVLVDKNEDEIVYDVKCIGVMMRVLGVA